MNGQINSFNHKLGFIIPSNRPEKLDRFILSVENYWDSDDSEFSSCIDSAFALICQHPVSMPNYENTVFEKITSIPPFKTSIKPMLQLRRIGLDLVKDCEYICCIDDDHEFTYASQKYYRMVIEIMDQYPNIGVAALKDKPDKGRPEIEINPKNGFMQNGTGGMLYRNIGIDKIFPRECWGFVGVMSEPLMGYSVMSHGYDFIKIAGCPNERDKCSPDKFVCMQTPNKTYSEQVANQNAQGYIRDRFEDPDWRFSDWDYPKKIKQMIGR